MWQMAIRTGRRLMVTAFLPRIVFIVHDVAVRAGPWILGKVTQALAIIEGVKTKAAGHAGQDGGNHRQWLPRDGRKTPHEFWLFYQKPDQLDKLKFDDRTHAACPLPS
jgi:hypothetical protein